MAISTVVATVNGTQVSLNYNSTSGQWEGVGTAPNKSSFNQSGKYYNVSLTATDDASNVTTIDATHDTLGSYLQFVVRERIAPIVYIDAPSASAYVINNTPTITFRLRDEDSGVDISTLALKIDGGTEVGSTASGMTCTAVAGGYDCAYIPSTALGDGSHTVVINVSDNDGNAATQGSVSFVVDTVAPALTVTTPVQGLITNLTTITVAGSTNDATSTPVTITVTLNGTDQGAVTVNGSTGAFTKTLSGLANGAHTIVVTATDAAGKTSTITRTITINTVAPVFESVEIIPNPADCGATYTIRVKVSGA